MLHFVAIAALLQSPAARVDTLSPSERAIVRWVDLHTEQAEQLLERIVNQNSGTMNLDGVRKVGAILRAEFDALGFATRWIDGTPFKRAGHLVAEHSRPGPKFLLIGHLDTVFEPESPFQKFERIDRTTARGPGIIDMKGGDVIIVQALRSLQAAGLLESMNIVVVMTGDEEDTGEPQSLARAALIEAARGASAAIGFEDGSGDPTKAVVARRGYTGWRLTVTAKPAHSSQIFRDDVGAGAVFEAARVLQEFRQRLSGERYLTFNPGLALGGTSTTLDSSEIKGAASGKANIVAEQMVVTGDIRTLSSDQLAAVKKAMTEIASQSLPHTRSIITFTDGYSPLPPSSGNEQLLSVTNQTSLDLGFGPVTGTDPMRAGAADVSFVSGLVPRVIDGVGLAGKDDHTPSETADLAALPRLIKRAAIVLARLGRELKI